MTSYISKKDIISSRVSYEENCSNKIMMIHTSNTSSTRKLLISFEKNTDDQICEERFESPSSRARNVL
jgi:hypothetical protein